MKFKALIMICDGPDATGTLYDINGLLHMSSVDVAPLSFTPFPYPPVGTASLSIEGLEVYALIDISDQNYAMYADFYPLVNLNIVSRSYNTATAWVIESILLTGFVTPDTRIKQLVHSSVHIECVHERVEMIFTSFCRKCDKTLPNK